MNKKEFSVFNEIPLEKLLLDKGFSFSLVKKMLKNKDIKVNDKRTSCDVLLSAGDKVTCFYSQEEKTNIEIVYEDDNVLIVNKPQNIETCGEMGLEGKLKAYAVHRLDRNTTGLTILAKNELAKEELGEVFKQKLITKKYICEVVGDSNFNNKIEKAYLFKDAKKSLVIISKDRKPNMVQIETKFNTVKHGNATSLVECELLTGKTHQIRAHLAFLNHAIIGDGKYGSNEINKKYKEKNQKLCCFQISFKELPMKTIANLSKRTFVKCPTWYRKG